MVKKAQKSAKNKEISQSEPQGNGAAQVALEKALLSPKGPQAFLLSGPRGVGVEVVARKAIQRALGGVDMERSPDFLCVERQEKKTGDLGEDISIEQIRAAIQFVQQTPLIGAEKYLLIKEAERLSQSAANALLKTLEEPPKAARIMLLTSTPQEILPTIRSRVAILQLQPLKHAEMEKFQLTPEEEVLVKGSPELVEKIKEGGWKEEIAQLRTLLRAPLPERVAALDQYWKKKRSLAEQREEWRERLVLWQKALRQDIRARVGEKDGDRLLVRFGLLGENGGNDGAVTIAERLLLAEEQLDAYVSPRAVIESIFLSSSTLV